MDARVEEDGRERGRGRGGGWNKNKVKRNAS